MLSSLHCVGWMLVFLDTSRSEMGRMPSGAGGSIKRREIRNLLAVGEALFDFALH